MSTPQAPVDVPPHILEYLTGHQTLTLATASNAGLPHAATLVYASDGLTLHCCMPAGTTTARHVAENPQVAFTIDEYSPDWTRTQGIQGRGECRLLLDPGEIRAAVAL